MLYVEQFIRHIRNQDAEDTMMFTAIGIMAFLMLGFVVGIAWALVEWLGFLVIIVPVILIAALLLFYGVGRWIINLIENS